jgi:hypothetical protein
LRTSHSIPDPSDNDRTSSDPVQLFMIRDDSEVFNAEVEHWKDNGNISDFLRSAAKRYELEDLPEEVRKLNMDLYFPLDI